VSDLRADFDVVVAGAGLPGLAAAAALARHGLHVGLADRMAVTESARDPETFDVRVYAISPGSASFLDGLGAWSALDEARLTAVESMRVEGDEGALITFSAIDEGERALAWIVEERELRNALVRAVKDAGVDVLAPGGFARLVFAPESATLWFDDGRKVSARLVVGADGVRSWVRQAAGIVAAPHPYGQTAVVANFACERPHRGCAYQWFRADGSVLAWLPLPGERISIVWSAPEKLAGELMTLDAGAFADRVCDAGARALGKLALITAAAAFPLSSLRLPATVAHRLVLVGDAAHGVHPLAGQGVNLGFGDAHALAAVIADRGPVTDPGTPILLERHARRRAEPVFAMHAVTDGLSRLFGARSRGLATLRNLGLSAVDALPIAKHMLAQPALRS
jgi:ubiquinone biosynthesis UbiH/UbiF/VisC/COQ6 family hydroxylase